MDDGKNSGRCTEKLYPSSLSIVVDDDGGADLIVGEDVGPGVV